MLILFSVFVCGRLSGTEKAFSLIVREGFGSIRVGDLNTTLSSQNIPYDIVKNWPSAAYVGEILPVPSRFKDWEVEFQCAAWKGLRAGIAVSGPLHFHNRSFVTYHIFGGPLPSQTTICTIEPEISVAAPVKLNLYYSLPILAKVNLTINGGAGYYRARMTMKSQAEIRFPYDTMYLGYTFWDASGRTVGYHCGLGLEYRFNERFSMMTELQWRFVKIRTFKGHWVGYAEEYDEYGNLTGIHNSNTDGILYHYLAGGQFGTCEKMTISDFPPPWVGVDDPHDIRHAFLDLGGFAFKMGLRVRLF